jgi:hypothetical protein
LAAIINTSPSPDATFLTIPPLAIQTKDRGTQIKPHQADASFQVCLDLKTPEMEKAKSHRDPVYSSIKESSEHLSEDNSPQKLIDLQLREIEREDEMKKMAALNLYRAGLDQLSGLYGKRRT